MATTGPFLGTAVSANTVSADRWLSDTDGLANTTFGGRPPFTGDIRITSFSSLNVPAGATVNGITVTVFGQGNSASNKPQLKVNNGSSTSSGKDCNGSFSKSDTTETWGGSSDLWGISWTPTTPNALYVEFDTSTIGGGGLVFWDWLKVTVDYTAGGYGHDTIGVAAANISSVIDVTSANIDKIIGVD